MRVPKREDQSLFNFYSIVTSASTLRVSPSVVVGTFRSTILASCFRTIDGTHSFHDKSFESCRSPFLFPELVRQAFVCNTLNEVALIQGSVAAIKQRVSNCCQLIFATVIIEQVTFSVISNNLSSPNRIHSPPPNTLSRRVMSSIVVSFLLLKTRECVWWRRGESNSRVLVNRVVFLDDTVCIIAGLQSLSTPWDAFSFNFLSRSQYSILLWCSSILCLI